MDVDFMIDLAARCQRVAILAELIRIRQARLAALKDNVSRRAAECDALPRQNFPSVAGGGFKSPAPGAHDLPSESNHAAGDRVGTGKVASGRFLVASGEAELLERPRVSAEEHNRFSRGRW